MISRTIPEQFQPKPVKGAAAFSKGISILQLIANAPTRPTMAELVQQSGLPRPTLHRLLKALAAERLVECTSDKRYIVGSRLIQFAGRALEQNNVAKLAGPELTWLCDQTNETIHLAIRDGHEMVYIQKQDSPQAIRLATSVGGRAPLHASAIGKVVLAFIQPEQQSAILEHLEMPKLTPNTITDAHALKKQLDEILEIGYSISFEESELEVRCFGGAIMDRTGQPVAGIAVSVPIYRLKESQFYIKPLVETCKRISRKLGA